MSTTTPCNCASSTSKTIVANERPRYYARQLVTPDDMTLEQEYFREKMRRHNRFLHGWGVVCGAKVVAADSSKNPWKVIVQRGYLLSPCGDEIFIETDQCIDVRTPCTPAPPAPSDCQEAQPTPPPNATQYVAVQYTECQTRLVRVRVGGCGCEDSVCEYTRFRDSYRICILDHCPDEGAVPRDIATLGKQPLPDCPPRPEESWVVLGSFTVDANGMVTVNECDCRRQVLGLQPFWWNCYAVAPAPSPQPAPPKAPGGSGTPIIT